MFDTEFIQNPQMKASSAAQIGTTDVYLVLQQLLQVQERQMELLEELVERNNATPVQAVENEQSSPDADPRLVRSCRRAAHTLNEVQTQLVETLAEEVNENGDDLLHGDFLLNELVDRYGPRLAHLNGVLQMLAQLGSMSPPTKTN